MLWVDNKYIQLLSSSLNRFRKSGSSYNFRCPFCLDSQKNKNKARGYLYPVNGRYLYYCHNCGESRSFQKFFKEVSPQLYGEYLTENFMENKSYNKEIKTPAPEFKTNVFSELKSVEELPDTHLCKKFVIERKIPKRY